MRGAACWRAGRSRRLLERRRRAGRRPRRKTTAITTRTIAHRPGPPPARTAAVPFSPAMSTGARAGRMSTREQRPGDLGAGHEGTVERPDRRQCSDGADRPAASSTASRAASTWKKRSSPASRTTPIRKSSWATRARAALPRNTPPVSSPSSRGIVERVPAGASIPRGLDGRRAPKSRGERDEPEHPGGTA